LSDVESVSDGEFKASVVGAYERGERAMSVQRMVRLSGIYGVDAAELLPLNRAGDEVVIDLDQLSSDQGDLAERLVAAIHLLRSGAASDAIRSSDRAVLASLMEAESTAQHRS
jgi:hypothetical protein